MEQPNPDAAIQAWRAALGGEAVADDEATLDRYARTTQPRGTRPACVLFPQSTDEVQSVVRVASEHRVPVYPISRGKNWGYGDACAPLDGTAIIDLSRMNRIVEVNRDLAYAVIEPGVSQQQLFDRLRGTGLWFDCTGAGGDASLVGNTLDRGFGHTPYGDHVLTACALEIVLADGRVLRTGFGHYDGAKASNVYRYGVGPFLDGLFGQSNFGVVTRLTLWLMPEPEAFSFFYLRAERDTDLAELVECLRRLRLGRVLDSAVHVGNDLRVLSGTQGYPWDETNGETPLPDTVRARLRRDAGLGAWNAAGAVTGTRAQVRAARKALRRAAPPGLSVRFVNDATLGGGRWAARLLGVFGAGRDLERKLRTLEPNYGLLKGVPTDEPLVGAQWRLRNPPDGPAAPVDLDCGLLWVSPVLPATGEDARAVADLVTPVFTQYGFEPLITFTLINERAIIAVMNIAFDKTQPAETAQATACYETLLDALIPAGYIPYRTGPSAFPKLRREGDVFWDVAAQLKRALDPQDIIAPGRYLPPNDR